MTAQLDDTVEYRKRTFQLVGVSGGVLFQPRVHGLLPQGMSTACQRGFLCAYRVVEKRLLLEELRIGLEAEAEQAVREGRGLALFGQQARYVDETHERVVYTRLRAPMALTGGLLLVEGIARGVAFSPGLHPAWGRRRIHELRFEDGRLVEERDCSEAMERVWERVRAQALQLDKAPHRAQVESWLQETFRLDYGRGGWPPS